MRNINTAFEMKWCNSQLRNFPYLCNSNYKTNDMIEVITMSEPQICSFGLSDCKTFNIGIHQIEDSEEGEHRWACLSHTVRNPSLCDIVPPYVARDVVFTEAEHAAIVANCTPSEYGLLVSDIIDARYPRPEMDAVRNNYDRVRDGKAGDKTEEYTREYEAMQDWRDYAKLVAKSFINL